MLTGLRLAIALLGGALLVLYLTNDLARIFADRPADPPFYIVAYALPLVMGTLSLVKPPLRVWHSALALAGFAAVTIKSKAWNQLGKFADYELRWKLWMIALCAGLAVSVAALAMLLANRERRTV